jgi:hypothetical protein
LPARSAPADTRSALRPGTTGTRKGSEINGATKTHVDRSWSQLLAAEGSTFLACAWQENGMRHAKDLRKRCIVDCTALNPLPSRPLLFSLSLHPVSRRSRTSHIHPSTLSLPPPSPCTSLKESDPACQGPCVFAFSLSEEASCLSHLLIVNKLLSLTLSLSLFQATGRGSSVFFFQRTVCSALRHNLLSLRLRWVVLPDPPPLPLRIVLAAHVSNYYYCYYYCLYIILHLIINYCAETVPPTTRKKDTHSNIKFSLQ